MNKKRKRETSKLPTLNKYNGAESEMNLLKDLYAEVNSNYRHLADIRFKLLGFVPAVSVIAWVELLNKISVSDKWSTLIGFILSLIATRITCGIIVYDRRNDDLYNDLISRGRKIEDDLGIHTGIFKGRVEGEKKLLGKIINHSRGLNLIYSSVFLGWILVSFWFLTHFLKTIL